MTLKRYIKRTEQGAPTAPGYSDHRKVFSQEQENILAEYIQDAASRSFGLTRLDVRKLAYQCAVKYGLNRPSSWDTNKAAGVDWVSGFKRRNGLSLRIAENTSLGRAISFNKPSVTRFFGNLLAVFEKHRFGPESIYNVDETGVTTVPKNIKVLAKTGTRSIGRIVSQEKGTLVSIVCAINAIGNSVPPMFLFPRKNYRDYFIRGAPPGAVGIANGSGWMTEEDFLAYIKHFANFAKPTAENPVLIILDNHVSHLYLPVIDFCRENYITLLSLPPHSSHKLQPLDRVIFGPFKTYFNNRSHAWSKENPGKSMTIYDVPAIVGETLPRAMLSAHVIQAFNCTGIWPVNKDIFTDADFAPSQLTETPLNQSQSSLTLGSGSRAVGSCNVRAETPPADPCSSFPAGSTSSLLQPTILLSEHPCTSETEPPVRDGHDAAQHILPQHETDFAQIPTTGDAAPLAAPGLDKEAELDPPSIPTEQPAEDISVTYSHSSAMTDMSAVNFSPACVMPVPRAYRNNQTKNSKRKKKSEVLTSTPVKKKLMAQQRKKKKAPPKKQRSKGQKKSKTKKKTCKPLVESSESEVDDYCIICIEPYSNSRPGEKWVKCALCEHWAHEQCTEIGSRNFAFICPNCDSD